jgi:hypothetical protein
MGNVTHTLNNYNIFLYVILKCLDVPTNKKLAYNQVNVKNFEFLSLSFRSKLGFSSTLFHFTTFQLKLFDTLTRLVMIILQSWHNTIKEIVNNLYLSSQTLATDKER